MASPDSSTATLHIQASLFSLPEIPAAPEDSSDEYYTPRDLIHLVNTFWPDGIDTDPATCAYANQVIGAKTIYTLADDGLAHFWRGRVWLNPPYSKPGVWIDHLTKLYQGGYVTEALVLAPSATSESWFQPLFDHTVLFFNRRLHFRKAGTEDCGAFDRPNALIYLGDRIAEFCRVFGDSGAIMTRTTDTVNANYTLPPEERNAYRNEDPQLMSLTNRAEELFEENRS